MTSQLKPLLRRTVAAGLVLAALCIIYLFALPVGAASQDRQGGSQPPLHKLIDSQALSSHQVVTPGDPVTYTILLQNSGGDAANVRVTDHLPPEVVYVSGSAQPAAAHDATARTLSWPELVVPPQGSAALTFLVTAATVASPTIAINAAIIATNDVPLQRVVPVLIAPESLMPPPHLAGSRTVASHAQVGCGERLTYTISLYNESTGVTYAQVTDNLPSETTYVAESAQPSATYDAHDKKLSWPRVRVPPGGSASLTFAITATEVATPTAIINTAIITSGTVSLERIARVLFLPEPSEPRSPLAGCQIFASPQVAGTGEEIRYTILLDNTGAVEIKVQVTDMLPAEAIYVGGSALPPATYDEGTRILTWTDVSVPAQSEITLSFSAVAAQVRVPVPSINRAVIRSGQLAHERRAKVVVVPGTSAPGPKLAGSHTSASRQMAVPGKQFDYTIRLHNSGIGEAVVTVSDPLPAEVAYVHGSSRPEAVYDEGTRTLTWNGIPVPAGGDESLVFGVTGSEVDSPTPVVNSASIAADGDSLTRSTTVLLVPKPPDTDSIPPTVDSVTISDRDVLNSQAVTLHISAFDDKSVGRMYIREWQWMAEDWPRWQATQSSGWIPYQPVMPWTLSEGDGAHYVGVWVADEAGNRSRLDGRSLDFASLITPGTQASPRQPVPYLVWIDAGVEVAAKLEPAAGDSSLHTWYAGALMDPIIVAAGEDKFKTEKAGTYLFMVRGQPGEAYDLSISPGGGPRRSPDASPRQDTVASDALNSEPLDLIRLLAQSGLDPLDTTDEPGDLDTIYLPLAAR